MLQAMQQSSPTQPSLAASGFAGILATLTAPKPTASEDESLWSSSDLGDDVASLSYERALRTHARYRPTHRGAEFPAPANQSTADTAASAANAKAKLTRESSKNGKPDRDLRSASVTIRLDKVESARLRERATEAGLTISAYLRSCVLEAETLRAEVKKTLAEIKMASEAPPAVQSRKPWFAWMGRIAKR